MSHSKSNPEDGQGLVEYALILLLVAITVAGALGIMGTSVADMYTDISAAFP